jgi:hypothetical protein
LLLLSNAPACLMTADDEFPDEGLGELESRVNNIAHLNIAHLNIAHLNIAHLNGASLNGVRLDGSQLTGFDPNGQPLAGTDFVGVEMEGELAGGGTRLMRIDAATVLPEPNSDVWAYAISFAETDGSRSPVCETDGVLAIPLAGTWNEVSGVSGGGSWTPSTTSFTLACRGGALAKCVEWGYPPWETWETVGGTRISLRDHHQACTRMVRADYCGDGHSHTTNGRLINIYDGAGVQADTETWPMEAEWTPDGASCVSAYARDALGITCSTVPATLECGDPSHFGAGTREMTETLLGPVPVTPPAL